MRHGRQPPPPPMPPIRGLSSTSGAAAAAAAAAAAVSAKGSSTMPCNCCPYGYHIDLDFVRYCEALTGGGGAGSQAATEAQRQRRDRRRQRKSMEVMLGFEQIVQLQQQLHTQQQPLIEVSEYESNSQHCWVTFYCFLNFKWHRDLNYGQNRTL